MIRSRNKKVALAALVLMLALALQLTPPARVDASDHIDSPTIAQDRGSDIADGWAFLDPNDNSKVILIVSTQGFIVQGEIFGMAIFDPNIRYRFEIENTGDARPDRFIDVTYSRGIGRLTAQTATITLPNGRTFTAPTTLATQDIQPTPPPAPVVTTDATSGVGFYAGMADDPFFLDDTGANLFVADATILHPGAPNKALLGIRGGRDTYAGFNTMITALSVPASMLKGAGNIIGINYVTQRRRLQINNNGDVVGNGPYVNVDREGNPLVNNGLIPGPRKNEYNGVSTVEDVNGRFQADIVKSLRGFTTDDAHISAILDLIQRKGDILRLDLTVPNSGPQGGTNVDGGFPNPRNGMRFGGRRLTDDVVDMVFTAINNGVAMTDNVNANELPFRNSFPFVADPTQPFPPGNNPDDHTRQ